MTTDRIHVAPGEYIDEDGLSERYLIPPRTAQRWRATGGGPPFVRLGRRRVVYRVADVERWLAERTYAHRADELARQLASKTE
jgi:Helix-turn-helix domain